MSAFSFFFFFIESESLEMRCQFFPALGNANMFPTFSDTGYLFSTPDTANTFPAFNLTVVYLFPAPGFAVLGTHYIYVFPRFSLLASWLVYFTADVETTNSNNKGTSCRSCSFSAVSSSLSGSDSSINLCSCFCLSAPWGSSGSLGT